MTRPGPGKFEGNESLEIAEYLYSQGLNGMADAAIGDVETFGFYELHLGVKDLFDKVNGMIPSDMRPFIDTKGTFIEEVKVAYITHEDNNGFFTYQEFGKNEDARLIWATGVEGAYQEFVRESDAYI